MELTLWAMAVIAINGVISIAITAIAFKKMYRIYHKRTKSLYELMDQLANACGKK